jgi:hypothetical protein
MLCDMKSGVTKFVVNVVFKLLSLNY